MKKLLIIVLAASLSSACSDDSELKRANDLKEKELQIKQQEVANEKDQLEQELNELNTLAAEQKKIEEKKKEEEKAKIESKKREAVAPKKIGTVRVKNRNILGGEKKGSKVDRQLHNAAVKEYGDFLELRNIREVGDYMTADVYK